MQIKNIVLYKNNDFKPRILPFKIGKVNIITGESSTGKTAIIDIIDYCLGSKNFNVKGIVIRDNVAWFAITVQFEGSQIFIARQNPTLLGLQTTNNIHFISEDVITVPNFENLFNNSNIKALNKFVTKKLGFNDNLHISQENTRDSLEATFKHSRLFSFQPQNVIAEFKYLFFNSDDGFVRTAIKDTLPYVLGAIEENELVILQEIKDKKRTLNKFLRERSIQENIQSVSMFQLQELVQEAKSLELLNPEIIIRNDNEALSELKQVLNIKENISSITTEDDELSALLDKRQKFKQKLSELRHEIKAVKDFSENSNDFNKETVSQNDRLLSIGLFKEPSSHKYWNALLGSEVDAIVPSLQLLNQSLQELQNSLQFTKLEKPKVQKILVELNKKESEFISEITIINKRIQSIYNQNQRLKEIKNINIRKGIVIGRISLFIESLKVSDVDSTLTNKINSLMSKIEILQSQLSESEKENKIHAILNKINILMSSWSNKLEWEYKNHNLRFDIKKLTVFADSDERSESLQQMGSGENWLACHIFLHLALHQHFIDKKRPTANFIIFDQPTQVHYPTGYKEESGKFQKSSDEEADEKMFSFLFEIAKKLSPKLQIIVTDHAKFENDNFNKALVEEWRDGEKLVPLDWLNS